MVMCVYVCPVLCMCVSIPNDCCFLFAFLPIIFCFLASGLAVGVFSEEQKSVLVLLLTLLTLLTLPPFVFLRLTVVCVPLVSESFLSFSRVFVLCMTFVS